MISNVPIVILCETCIGGRMEMYTGFWLDSRKGRDQLECYYGNEIK
jgi:hypothetical protein